LGFVARAARLVGNLAGIGLATEFARHMVHGTGGPIGELAAKAGIAFQRHASTAEPTDADLEVAQAAVDEVLRLDGALPALD
jgi:hypothetical protein